MPSGKPGSLQTLVADHAERHGDVAQQLAVAAIAEAAVVSEFVDLADIVQHRAGDQQIHIDVRILAATARLRLQSESTCSSSPPR